MGEAAGVGGERQKALGVPAAAGGQGRRPPAQTPSRRKAATTRWYSALCVKAG